MGTSSLKRWFRFSLATLLVAVTALSLWLGRQSYLTRRQNAAVNAIVAAEGIVIFGDESRTTDPQPPPGAAPSLRDRFRRSIGEDYFRTVKTVDFATNLGRRKGTGQPKATEKNLALLASLRDVEILELSHNETVNDATLVHLRGLRNLQTLYLYHTGVRGPGLVHLIELPKLQSLQLSYTSLGDEGLAHIGKMDRLKWLQLAHTSVTDAGLAHLANLKNLETMSLKCTDITDESLVHLKQLPKLEELVLSGTKITADGADSIRRWLPNCDVHVTFGLGRSPVNIEWFPEGHQPSAAEITARFKELGIDGHVRTDQSQSGNPITELYLGDTTFADDAALKLIDMMPLLKSLVVRNALVGDTFVKGLHDLESLIYLELRAPRVTGAGLQHLSQLSNLRELLLEDMPITDANVPQLAELKQVKRLYLRDTRTSDEGFKQLQQALPNCEISPR